MESTILIKSINDIDWAFEVTYPDKGKDWTKKVLKDVPGIEYLVVNKHITWTLEKKRAKDGKDYLNVTNIRPAILPEPPQTPAPPPSKPETHPVKSQVYSDPDSMFKCNALNNAWDGAGDKVIVRDDIPVWFEINLRLLRGDIKVSDERVMAMVMGKKSEPVPQPEVKKPESVQKPF